jgi:PTS system fructose-specific IIC component
MPALITSELVALDADLGSDKTEVNRRLAGLVADAGRATGTEALHADVMAREAQVATGLTGGIAIPHCRSEAVTEPSLAFARLSPTVDYGAPDGPADLVFLIAAPAHGDADHLTLLTALARALVRPEFVASLRSATSAGQVVRLVEEVVSSETAAGAAVPAPPAAETAPGRRTSLVVISACPTGIAHTYMAADKLAEAGRAAGADVHVETQGSAGSTPLDPAVVREADAVIFAVDVGVKDQDRFAGKPLVRSGTRRAINEPEVMVREALAAAADPNARRVPGAAGGPAAATTAREGGPGIGSEIRRWLLTGVSYMIPFVAAGGLLIALGYAFGGYRISENAREIVIANSLFDLPGGGLPQYIGAVLYTLGTLAFDFLVPALAGYIAYAIADRPGIAPGFTVGVVATTVGAGFLGGVIGGVVAGLTARSLARLPVPRLLRGLMPVAIIPLGATLAAGGLMVLVLGRPLASATEGLANWLTGLSGASIAVLGIVLGLMMAFDMGGPVNKAAYAFATTGLADVDFADQDASRTPLVVMATVMAAGMVPPLALALASLGRPRLFTPAERENGKAAWLLGLAFITEGAIPFAAADPLRVIPSIMLGSATTGAIVAAGGAELAAPHGGVFVMPIAMDGVPMFLAALGIGTVVGALAVVVAKGIGRPRVSDVPDDAVDLEHMHAPEAHSARPVPA